MLRLLKRFARRATNVGDSLARRISPGYRAKRKYATELAYWHKQLDDLRQWHDGRKTWWGVRPVSEKQPADHWATSAVLMLHAVRPTYLEELQLDRDHFRGRRVLEVGCGPLFPLLAFADCDRHGLDPLNQLYLESGWPLYDYAGTLVTARGEAMPYPDGYFDAAISVNALDHVDDFAAVAAEMQRVVKPGGEIRFEVEYHAPTTTEPLALEDGVVQAAFGRSKLTKLLERGKREMFTAIVQRFSLDTAGIPGFAGMTNRERFALWAGSR